MAQEPFRSHMVALREGFNCHRKQKQTHSELRFTGTEQQRLYYLGWEVKRQQKNKRHLSKSTTTMTSSPFFAPCGIYSFIHLLMCSSHFSQVPKRPHRALWLRAEALCSSRPARFPVLPFDQLCPWTSHVASLSLRCLSAVEYSCGS